MFQKEEREGRGEYCQTFSTGQRIDYLPLDQGELVYGIYKEKYYFTPIALCITQNSKESRIEWRSVVACSTQHGDGSRTSVLTLANGDIVEIAVSELAKGWTGRISQLYHQMIETLGGTVSISTSTIEEFVSRSESDASLFPNLYPHPGNESLARSVTDLMQVDGITDLRIQLANDDRDSGIGLIFRTFLTTQEIDGWVERLGSAGTFDETALLANVFEDLKKGERIIRTVWD